MQTTPYNYNVLISPLLQLSLLSCRDQAYEMVVQPIWQDI